MPIDSGPSRKRLPLSRLKFGNIDARYEVLTRDPQTRDHFRESFSEPSGLSVEEFMRGERFFVYGMKGAGKTALLRYIQIAAEEDRCLTKFISFAPEISEVERERIYKQAHIQTFEQKEVDPGRDAVNLWLIFILRQIVRVIEENRRVFTTHQDIRILCELIKRTYEGEDKGVLAWLSNALKRGKYKVKSKHFEGSISGKSEKERDYTVDAVIEQSCSLLRSLSWEGRARFYMFFDELNLSFASKLQHQRDAVLIRDLIIAIDRMNSLFIELEKPIFILAAARSEVLNAIRVPTHEINKILTDRGRELIWFSNTASGEWPIAKLFANKVRASEKLAGYPETRDVFSEYFYRDVFNMSAKSLVVELTWCNPRDLVMLFGKAASLAHDEPFFGEEVLERALDDYSRDAWREKTEELTVEYHPAEILSMKKILSNFRRYFKIDHFEREGKDRGERDKAVENLMGKRRSAKILEDLYRVGVIGQSTREPRDLGSSTKQFNEHWAYRGDHNFDPKAWMIVHRALWPELRLGRVRGALPESQKMASAPVVVRSFRRPSPPRR